MKELKLDVVRFENDDIMTTSCASAVYAIEVDEGSIVNQYKKISFSASYDWKYAVSNQSVPSDGFYHIDSNGVIEACNNQASHTGTGWETATDLGDS